MTDEQYMSILDEVQRTREALTALMREVGVPDPDTTSMWLAWGKAMTRLTEVGTAIRKVEKA